MKTKSINKTINTKSGKYSVSIKPSGGLMQMEIVGPKSKLSFTGSAEEIQHFGRMVSSNKPNGKTQK